MMDEFKKAVIKALEKALDLKVSESKLSTPPNGMGDYSFPCFRLGKNPVLEAEKLKAKIKLPKIISRIEIKGPYLNFYVDKTRMIKTVLVTITKQKKSYGSYKLNKKNKVVIEFPGPNTNKPLHLGHLRNMLLGQSIVNISRFVGQEVIPVNINNDRGIHVCKSLLAYKKWGKNQDPNKKSDHFVGDFYVKFEQESMNNPYLEDEARALLLKWERGDKDVRALWKKMNSWAYQGFKETYKKFGIKYVKEYYESEMYEKAKVIVERALKKGLFKKDDKDNVVAKLGKFGFSDKVVLRSDGTTVYMTQDLFLAQQREKDFKADNYIYVVASEQNLHFQQLFKILDLIGFKKVKGLYHLSYGMIFLPSGKMKSREGKVIDTDNVVEDMKQLSLKELKQRYNKLARSELDERADKISMAAIKFFILSYDPKKDFVFKPEESISFEGETGPYVQYVYARINSILRKSIFNKVNNPSFALLGQDIELELAKMLKRFPELVMEASQKYKPSILCRYLLDLSQLFNNYYQEHMIIQEDKDLEKARLYLIKNIKQVLENGLNLLGIKTLEIM